MAWITFADSVERLRARVDDAGRGGASITAGMRLAGFGQIDLNLSELGRDDGRSQPLQNIRRFVQSLNSLRLIEAIGCVIDDVATLAAKFPQFAKRIGHGITQSDAPAGV